MKERRKASRRNRGQLLLLKKLWTTRFGSFRNFWQKGIVSSSERRAADNRRKSVLSKGLQLRNSVHNLLREEGFAPESKKNFLQAFYKRHPRRSALRYSLYRSVLCRRKINRQLCSLAQVSNEAKYLVTLEGRLSNRASNKKDFLLTTKHDDDDDDENTNISVTFNSHAKLPSYILKPRCFDGLWLSRNCSLFSEGKVPLFMMYKKLSVFTTRGRIQTQKFSARNCSFKLVGIGRPWIQKVFWKSCRKSLRRKFLKAISYLKSQIQRPVQFISRAFDMNNNTSGILCENKQRTINTCLKEETVKLDSTEDQLASVASGKHILKSSQRLHCTASQWEGGESIPRKVGELPTANSSSDDSYVFVMGKEVSISCQEDAESQMEEDDERMLLAPDKLKLCSNENAEYQDNIPMDVVENGADPCHMDVEGSRNLGFCNTKLLDHPYCKSPSQGSTSDEALDAMGNTEVKNGKKIDSCVPDEQLSSCLFGLLNEIIKKYGSLIPLSEKDVLTRLKELFNEDFSNRISFISREIMKYRAKHSKAAVCNFRILYNRHVLDMDDLATLDGQNWLNDQVINMYGELIMDAVPDKVHFLNSFFHRQLVTKGYNGVKRWTKKVDVFKKTLLLIPIHLEVHWSLITVNIPNKLISFYDSQGIHFKFCVENIRKYLLTEAKEKNHPEFLSGWQTAVTKCIPQQKNDSDCGVFVLQYCKCLALEQPFQFSQEDMPRVRKRIYKELCECRLMD
ncbi:sentrin-specific protease 5 [Spea bombifrons]|uniref:sentrin-specific protease 5 n=1 Tax=Spea bombifrons TaxID=233779 RepID=UPI002348F0CF|nr:sentrin-specific protease 5 [Spea bombifrons]